MCAAFEDEVPYWCRWNENPNLDAVDENIFIPRRMLNAVARFVTVARDMEQIRRGKDIFKVCFLVTCIETLQILKKAGKNRLSLKARKACCLTFLKTMSRKTVENLSDRTSKQFVGFEPRRCFIKPQIC